MVAPRPPVPDIYLIERFMMRGAPGFGISDSSTRGVLEAAGELYREGCWPLDIENVIKRALKGERERAGGRSIGFDDVVPIVRGKGIELHTSADGEIIARPIRVNSEFVSKHMLFAFNPCGKRHDAPDLLATLFTHPGARSYVAAISKVALATSAALEREEIAALASCISAYMNLFSSWSAGRVINRAFAEMEARLRAVLGERLLAVKPPGAGGAESMMALVNGDAMREALTVFEQSGWSAIPLTVCKGLTCLRSRSGRTVRFTAPHRIDLVGAADLGVDPTIAAAGVCCSLAIEPRCELRMKFLPTNQGSFSQRDSSSPNLS